MDDVEGSITAVYDSPFTSDYMYVSMKDLGAMPPRTITRTAFSI